MRLFIGLWVWLLAGGLPALAQLPEAAPFRPEARFARDSILTGEPVAYTLRVDHPVRTQVAFPDSTYDFTPFEFVSYAFFPTRSDTATSVDSAVYTLRTFEVDTALTLALPVYALGAAGDSQTVRSAPQSLRVVPTVVAMPDSVVLRKNTELVPLSQEFNYPYLLVGLVAVVVLVGLVLGLFGGRLVRALAAYRLRRRQQRFERAFERAVDAWTRQPTDERLGAVVKQWKQHLEWLTRTPFTTYSTKDVAAVFPDTDLLNTLGQIDRQLYGGAAPPAAPDGAAFAALRARTAAVYQERQAQLRHA